MKNFADGAGIGTKQATAALQEYQKDQSEINKAKRELGKLEFSNRHLSTKEAQDRSLKYQAMVDRHEDNQFRILSTLSTNLTAKADTKVRQDSLLFEKQREFDATQARKIQEAMRMWDKDHPEIMYAQGSKEHNQWKLDRDAAERKFKNADASGSNMPTRSSIDEELRKRGS
jgi:hypothetical protein